LALFSQKRTKGSALDTRIAGSFPLFRSSTHSHKGCLRKSARTSHSLSHGCGTAGAKRSECDRSLYASGQCVIASFHSIMRGIYGPTIFVSWVRFLFFSRESRGYMSMHKSPKGEANTGSNPIDWASNRGFSKGLRIIESIIKGTKMKIRDAWHKHSSLNTNISSTVSGCSSGLRSFSFPSRFPWFKNATVQAILKVELHGEDHLYWPNLT